MDYSIQSYTVKFDVGVTRASFNVSVHDDNLFEGNETFNLNINPSSLPSSITIGDHGQTTVTIVNDDGK